VSRPYHFNPAKSERELGLIFRRSRRRWPIEVTWYRANAGSSRPSRRVAGQAQMTENPSMLAIVVRSFGGPEALHDVHNPLRKFRFLAIGHKIVTHNAREFVRVGGLGLEDWPSTISCGAEQYALRLRIKASRETPSRTEHAAMKTNADARAREKAEQGTKFSRSMRPPIFRRSTGNAGLAASSAASRPSGWKF